MMVPVIGQQPIEGELNVLNMSGKQILNLITATHGHVPADHNFDAHSVFVVVNNILKRSTRIVDNVLLGQEHLENLEEKVSRASFDPLLCILKQLSSEMASKAPGVEIAHKTTMSILDKLSSYSWNAKAVLTLAAFALDYENFSALVQLHLSYQLVESVEIPKHVPVTLKNLDLQKYEKTIGELNKIINDTLDIMEFILIESKKLPTYIMVGVYWIIFTVVACTTQMRCLTSNEVKTQDLLPLAQKISLVGISIEMCPSETEEMKARRKLKQLLRAPDEIMEVFKGLIFARDDMQSLIDGSTNKMVSIDMLKKKNVLLFISSLDISKDDISILMPIYDRIKENEYQYKIVWIPIVEQWTDDMQKKFEMLRSKMPWYTVQYFSPVAGIKFIKEEWHFDNEPILVVMNPEGDVENENAFDLIRQEGMQAFPFNTQWGHTRPCAVVMRPPGPYTIEKYTFHCGGKDNRWVEQFSKKVNVVAEDPIIKEAYISIELSCVGKGYKQQRFWKHTKTQKTESNSRNHEIQNLLLSFKNESRWAVLTKWSTMVVSDNGATILKVLEAFEEWKVNVPERGFEICFNEYHGKLLQTNTLQSRRRTIGFKCYHIDCFTK